jgi:glycosyltransferase involved in cell wall biosynthesis
MSGKWLPEYYCCRDAVFSRENEPLSTPHLVWLYPGPLDKALDAATWLEMTKALQKLGWQVTLIGSGPSGHRFVDGVKIASIPKPPQYVLGQIVFHAGVLRFLLREWDTNQVVLFHQMTAPWILPMRFLRVFTRKDGPLFVLDIRDVTEPGGTPRDRVRLIFQKFAFRMSHHMADGETAITQRMARLIGIPAKRLWGTWPSGVTSAHFARAQKIRQWPGPGDPIHMIYAGVFLSHRNLLPLASAVNEANSQGMAFVLSFLGDGPLKKCLQEVASQSNGGIRVIPPVPNKRVFEFLGRAHVGVTSLFSEDQELFLASSPIKLFEYMASGLPVLATRVACYTDVASSAEYVFWAEDAKVPAIFATLRQIWTVRETLEDLGEQAAAAAGVWSWTESAKSLNDALKFGLRKASKING